MPKLAYIVTVPITAQAFLTGQIGYLKTRGFDVCIITSPGPGLEDFARREAVEAFALPIDREISPGHDAISLFRIQQTLRRVRPDIVNASTPKAGLVGMLAAAAASVPVRIYQLRGLRMETATGFKRQLLASAERAAAAAAHYVVCNGQSLLDEYAQLQLAPRSKLRVLGEGSSNGVDASKYSSSQEMLARAAELRKQMQIDDETVVFGFVGRLTRDKGITELVEAFAAIHRELSKTSLLLVGDFEPGDPVPDATVQTIREHPAIVCTGFVTNAAPYYHLMDLLVFPSYREGFPNAPLEASVAGRPTIGFRATGVVDAVVDGATGILVPLGSIRELSHTMKKLALDATLRNSLGMAARERALTQFRPELVWKQWADFYRACLEHRAEP